MSLYIDTTGDSTLGVALCARCSRKFRLSDLISDPNSPNLMVCKEDLDDYDPYRLAPRPADQITLPFTRPDLSLVTSPAGFITQDSAQFIVTEDGERFISIVG